MQGGGRGYLGFHHASVSAQLTMLGMLLINSSGNAGLVSWKVTNVSNVDNIAR